METKFEKTQQLVFDVCNDFQLKTVWAMSDTHSHADRNKTKLIRS